MGFLRSRSIDALLLTLLGVYAVVGFTSTKTFPVVVFGNIAQALLAALAVLALGLNAWQTRKHQRAFWVCMASGAALWLAGQCMWVEYEVFLKRDIPNPFFADILFFLHTVPFIAAATLRPHAQVDEGDHHLRLGSFDFGMLLVWWIFIYGYIVGPWQYIEPNVRDFGSRYNFLYLIENICVIVAFGLLWFQTRGPWRGVYIRMFLAHTVYTASSFVLNVAIDRGLYHTGGMYDIPLVASLLLLAYVGFFALRTKLEPEQARLSLEKQSSWHGRLAALAVISMPMFAFYDAMMESTPDSIQYFRLLLTLACMLILMLLLFFKQALLDRKLLSLLRESRESYDDLQRLQNQLVQTEKLASIGRLVAGAAHEINNPLTAILGYSDLLVGEETIAPEHRDMADKIRQQARRTKHLVQNFLTFAKQAPVRHQTHDLNRIVANALQLQELDLGNKNIEMVLHLGEDPIPVSGDENHLLQLCVHLFNNAADAMSDAHGKGTLTVTVLTHEGKAEMQCQDTGPGVLEPARIFDPFYTTKAVGKGTGLGLSACYGIVRDHGGQIGCLNLPEGGALFVVSLPLADAQPAFANAQTSVG
jgi:signal transduction histidine kinase